MIRRPLRLAVCNLAVVFLLPSQLSWAATGAPTSTVSYAGQQVVRLTARSQEDVDFLLQLNVDVWDCFGPGIGTLEARVTLDQLKALADRGIPYEILVSDLQFAEFCLFLRRMDRLGGSLHATTSTLSSRSSPT